MSASAEKKSLPITIYLLCFGTFAIVTSEFQVSGMMPVMSADLQVSIPEIGYLITLYAFAMAFGGPLLAMLLFKPPPKTALIILYVLFIGGEILGATAQSYYVLCIARLMTGAAAGAFFGLSMAISSLIVTEERRGWANSIVLTGIMLGAVLGLPVANIISTHFGWRESFWVVSGLVSVAALVSIVWIPTLSRQMLVSLKGELNTLVNPKLWAAFFTSFLIIGATFAAFSYFTPILKNITGYGDGAVATLLFIYGGATVIGNLTVGKMADKYTTSTLVTGSLLLAFFLALFGLFADSKIMSLIAIIGIGLVGVTMNPAMVVRVMRAANARSFVNTLHASAITFGVVVGSLLGGLSISAGFGLQAPLWVGFIMALGAFLSLIPTILSHDSQRLPIPPSG